MANTFLNPSVIARAALGLLSREVVLPMTVNRSAETEFNGVVGDTITIRKPASLTSRLYTNALRTAGTPIVIDDLTETGIALVLDNHVYSGVGVTDEQLALNISDFGVQVLNPQVLAVAIGLENVLAAKLNAVVTTGYTTAAGGTDLHSYLLKARKTLNNNNVPQDGRYLAVSPDVEQVLLADAENKLIRYTSTGDSPNSALRDANVGRLYGFTIVVSNALTANTAVAYHTDAFALATRAPVVPDGATFGSAQTYAGLGMRWLRDYDAAFLRDRSIVSALAGAVATDTARAIKITLTP